MALWTTFYRTRRPLQEFPRIAVCSAERRSSTDYLHLGKFRPSEPQCTFQYTLRGRGFFRDATGEHPVPAGTGFLCKVSDPSVSYGYPADAEGPWEFVYVDLVGPSVDRMVREMVERFGAIYTMPARHPLVRRWFTPPPGATGTRTVEIEAGAAAAVVMEILTGLLGTREDATRGSEAGALVQAALKLLDSDQKHSLNATLLARRLNVSREHLSRIFHEETGQPLYACLTRRRVLEACDLLKNSPLSHKEIATALNFGSPAQFARIFRRVMRLSPSEFRRHGSLPLG